jgi:DNA-binding transcriptional MerR regulator
MSERTPAVADSADESVPLLLDEEIDELERLHPEGLTSQDVVSAFAARGARLSEATFRKYVQLGLLPRSRRVRRQGARGGSLGLYPASVIRRIIEIKQLLAKDFTMDEIRQKFLCATSEIDEFEEAVTRVFGRFEDTIAEMDQVGKDTSLLRRELSVVKVSAERLIDALRGIERRLEVQAREQTNQGRKVV